MVTRRDWLRSATAAGAALAAGPSIAQKLGGAVAAATAGPARKIQDLITRAVPSTGDQLPIVGVGSSATFRRMADAGEVDGLREVLRTLVENGGTVLDTAPSYGKSEEVCGDLAEELGIADQLFWATKVNVAGRDGTASRRRAVAQIEDSFDYLGVDVIDLIQVHNVRDPQTQVPVIQELKEEGRVRYIGITSTTKRQYADLAKAMEEYPLDFIGIDYAVDNTSAAEMILPLAQEREIAVLGYVPFGRTRLWRRVEDREVPEWAQEFGAESWAQFFIKFAAAHPAMTVVTPGTSRPEHMLDNLGAARGRLPDADEQARMVEFVDGLPQAPRRG